MKNPMKENRSVGCKPGIYNGVDSHQWAQKMEMSRLVSSKPKEPDKLHKHSADKS